MKPVLLDTGVVVALLDRASDITFNVLPSSQKSNGRCVTCEAVIADSCCLLRQLTGACDTVLDNIAKGAFLLPFQLSPSASAVRSVMREYSDVPVFFADACLVQLAKQLNTGDLLTLDQDFQFADGAGATACICSST